MMGVRQVPLMASAVALVIVSVACAGGDGSGTLTEGVSSTVVQPGPSSSPPPANDEDPTVPLSLLELRGELGIDTLVLEPTTESGSHPTLRWQPADGAASYWLVLRDGGGRPYWTWTGSETSVRVGGGDRPELNQTAALHEPMSWSVAAFDAQGSLVALSDPALVSP